MAASAAPDASPTYSLGQVLVKFRAMPSGIGRSLASQQFSLLSASAQELLTRYQVQSLRRIFPAVTASSTTSFSAILNKNVTVPDLYAWCVLRVSSTTDITDLAARMRREPQVENAEPNYFVSALETTPNDPSFGLQWFHKNTGQFSGGLAGADLRSTFVWSHLTASTVKIAVLDTGISSTHADLVANTIAGRNIVDNNAVTEDGYGHGTHVAGIIGARGNNGVGVAGILWTAQLMPVRVLDNSGTGTMADVAEGIAWAADNGAKIENMSLGGTGASSILEDAVNYAYGLGVLIVASAGNDGTETVQYPCRYDNVVCVAATDHADKIATFSTRGSWVDIAAPGENIFSTLATGACPLCDPTGYGYLDGTSMASPMVAGVAGLILARHPSWTPTQVRTQILTNVTDINARNPTLTGKFGTGRLNAAAAVFQKPAVVTSIALTPDNTNIANGSIITNYAMSLSSDASAPQVRVSLINQLNQELGVGTTTQVIVAGELNVSGNIHLGAISTTYPLTSRIILRATLVDDFFTVSSDLKTWNFSETESIPVGGAAAVWNPLFDPRNRQSATVRLTLNRAGHVRVRIFTTAGRLVQTLADEETAAGVRTWDWSGTNTQGSLAASGLYLVHIQAPGVDTIKKMVLVK